MKMVGPESLRNMTLSTVPIFRPCRVSLAPFEPIIVLSRCFPFYVLSEPSAFGWCVYPLYVSNPIDHAFRNPLEPQVFATNLRRSVMNLVLSPTFDAQRPTKDFLVGGVRLAKR